MTTATTYLKLKALPSDEDEWLLEGWATRAVTDRADDFVVPSGAKFELPMVLLAQHRHDAPIGSVIHATVSAAGIRIKARLTKGVALAAEMWELVKTGAMSLSVGFRALKTSPLPSGGTRFDSWEWFELSVVSVPCCPGTNVQVAVGKSVAYTEPGTPTRMITVPASTSSSRPKPKAIERRYSWETDAQFATRQFDGFIELLPTELQPFVSERHSGVERGKFAHLCDHDGQPLATIDLRTRSLRLASDPEPVPARKSVAAARARKKYDKKLVKVVVAVAKRVRVVDKTISGVAQAIVELNERLEALEKGAE